MARRFRFRLESLLKLRKSLEDEAQRHLARMLALQAEAEALVEDLRKAQERTLEARRVEPGGVVDVDLRRAVERYLVVLERRLVQAEEALRAAEARVSGARLALLKAHQAHLTLLRLKEQHREQHDFEMLKEDQGVADELAILRYRFTTRPVPVSAVEVNP